MQWRSFRERSNFPQIWFQDLSSLEFEVSKSSMWKHTTLCDKGVFSFTILTTLTTNWAQIFGGSLFYAYVEIHQVRRLVFVNYQQCPVALNINLKWLNCHRSSRRETPLITTVWADSLVVGCVFIAVGKFNFLGESCQKQLEYLGASMLLLILAIVTLINPTKKEDEEKLLPWSMADHSVQPS